MKYLLRIVVSAVALGAAAFLVPGIVVGGYAIDGHVVGHGAASKALTLLVVAVIFGVINAVLKPLIKVVGCAFYVATLGLAALVVNGLLLWLASYMAGELKLPFHVTGFVPAVEGALIVGVVSWVLHLIIRDDR